MGRIRQEIPKGNFVFKNKANTKGKRILYLRYYVNGIPVMTSTGISVRESEWDSRRESVKSINPASERLNKRLREKREEIDKQIGLYPGHLTIGILRDMMNGRYRNKEASHNTLILSNTHFTTTCRVMISGRSHFRHITMTFIISSCSEVLSQMRQVRSWCLLKNLP